MRNTKLIAALVVVVLLEIFVVACDNGPEDFLYEEQWIYCTRHQRVVITYGSPSVYYDAKLLLQSIKDGNTAFAYIPTEWLEECAYGVGWNR